VIRGLEPPQFACSLWQQCERLRHGLGSTVLFIEVGRAPSATGVERPRASDCRQLGSAAGCVSRSPGRAMNEAMRRCLAHGSMVAVAVELTWEVFGHEVWRTSAGRIQFADLDFI
jgi:hypothetical protein